MSSSLAQSNEIPAPVADDVAGDGHHPEGAHAVPKRILIGVYLLLCMFTVITVAVSQIDLGPANIWVALFVAVIKASLVVLFFMHIWWDSPFNGVVLIIAMFFVALFIGIAMLDTKEYGPNFQAPELVRELTGAGAAAPTGEGSGPVEEIPGALTQAQVDEIWNADPSKDAPRIKTMSYDAAVKGALDDKGDWRLGMAIFQKQGCVKCHTINENEPPRAPYLGNVTLRHPDPVYVLQSVLQPSAYIAPGFETNAFRLSNQQDIIEGFLISESVDSYSVRDTNGQVTTFPKSLVTLHKVLPKSLMTEGLASDLSVHDLASIHAFLDSLSKPHAGE
jgi:cytochrome c oxidase subunit 4